MGTRSPLLLLVLAWAGCLPYDAREPDTVPGDTEVDTDADADTDSDTDGDTDTGPLDADGDGWTVADGDCDDGRAEVHPSAEEVCHNGLDDDCDGDPGDCALPSSASLGEVGNRWSGASYSWAGRAVAGAGDVDGDGFADMVVGAPNAGGSRGAAYLVLGDTSPSGGALGAAIEYTGTNGLGESVSGVGDFDGDGLEDFAVGEPSWIEGSGAVGRAYLVMGSSNLQPGPIEEYAIAYTGTSTVTSCAGSRVAAAGDVDGDGLADLLVGAPYWGPTDTAYCGAAYLLLGRRTPGSGLLETSGLPIVGESSAQTVGASLAGAGDVDGDGLDDFLVGAPYERGASGAVYLFLGAGDLTATTISAAAARVWTDTTPSYLGYGLAGVGDVDADGYDDVLMGAHGTEAPGAAFLVLGAAIISSRAVEAADARYDGSLQESAGYSVAGPGDVNRDGHDDLLIGAGQNGDAGPNAGAAYLVLGSPAPAGRPLVEADAKLTGEDANDYLGYEVAGAGDVNGDGTPDLLFGVFARDECAGAAYLVLGVAE
ncbi:MAG: integrin alpha [Pseudomonadota bacterium]